MASRPCVCLDHLAPIQLPANVLPPLMHALEPHMDVVIIIFRLNIWLEMNTGVLPIWFFLLQVHCH